MLLGQVGYIRKMDRRRYVEKFGCRSCSRRTEGGTPQSYVYAVFLSGHDINLP